MISAKAANGTIQRIVLDMKAIRMTCAQKFGSTLGERSLAPRLIPNVTTLFFRNEMVSIPGTVDVYYYNSYEAMNVSFFPMLIVDLLYRRFNVVCPLRVSWHHDTGLESQPPNPSFRVVAAAPVYAKWHPNSTCFYVTFSASSASPGCLSLPSWLHLMDNSLS